MKLIPVFLIVIGYCFFWGGKPYVSVIFQPCGLFAVVEYTEMFNFDGDPLTREQFSFRISTNIHRYTSDMLPKKGVSLLKNKILRDPE
jgi:hypothetical protein